MIMGNYIMWISEIKKAESLGQKLKKINDDLESAKIKSAQEKANADFAKLEKERNRYQQLVNEIERHIVEKINNGKYPFIKIENYELTLWVREARKNTAKFQNIWDLFIKRINDNSLSVMVREAHDGVGVNSWLEITVEPRFGAYRDQQ